MTDKPFLDIKDDFVGIYSGSTKDSVPMIAFSHNQGEFILQIPGGGSIVLPLDAALRFAVRISNLADNAIEARGFQRQVDGGYFDWISEE